MSYGKHIIDPAEHRIDRHGADPVRWPPLLSWSRSSIQLVQTQGIVRQGRRALARSESRVGGDVVCLGPGISISLLIC